MLRSLAATIVLVALYYLLPLDHLAGVPLAVIVLVGLLALLAGAAWQLRQVIDARYPAVRAAEALATTVPLFLLLPLIVLAVIGQERYWIGVSTSIPAPGRRRWPGSPDQHL